MVRLQITLPVEIKFAVPLPAKEVPTKIPLRPYGYSIGMVLGTKAGGV